MSDRHREAEASHEEATRASDQPEAYGQPSRPVPRGPFFLDANVVMYAVGKEHRYKESCVGILREIEASRLLVVTNVEVLQELLHHYRSLKRSDLATEVYRSTRTLCERILPIDERDLDVAHELLEQHPGIHVRDAIHAATCLRFGLDRILSTDRHFDALSKLDRIDPAGLVDEPEG